MKKNRWVAGGCGAFGRRCCVRAAVSLGWCSSRSDVLTSADPTSLTGIVHTGRGEREIFNRRLDAYLFDARYAGGVTEFQVNPEFGSIEAARVEVVGDCRDVTD